MYFKNTWTCCRYQIIVATDPVLTWIFPPFRHFILGKISYLVFHNLFSARDILLIWYILFCTGALQARNLWSRHPVLCLQLDLQKSLPFSKLVLLACFDYFYDEISFTKALLLKFTAPYIVRWFELANRNFHHITHRSVGLAIVINLSNVVKWE